MLYQVDEECLSEYISIKRLELGSGIVEHLCDLRDVIEDDNTKKFLQKYINKFSKDFCICKDCFNELLSIVTREIHFELDGMWSEDVISSYECEGCGMEYDY